MAQLNADHLACLYFQGVVKELEGCDVGDVLSCVCGQVIVQFLVVVVQLFYRTGPVCCLQLLLIPWTRLLHHYELQEGNRTAEFNSENLFVVVPVVVILSPPKQMFLMSYLLQSMSMVLHLRSD